MLNYVYHYISESKYLNIVRKSGIGSPKFLKENYPDIFEKTSFKVWEERTKKFLNKKDITHDDVIYYLDNRTRHSELNSNAIYFTFLPISKYDSKIQKAFHNSIECKVDVNFLKKEKPYILFAGKVVKYEWNDILNDDFINNKIMKGINKKPGLYLFSNIYHLGVNIYNIPRNKFDVKIFKTG